MAGKFSLSGDINLFAQTARLEAQINKVLDKPRSINFNTSSAELNAYTKNLKAVAKQSKDSATALDDFSNKAALAGKRFAAFTAATTGFFFLTSAFKKGITEASNFEVELLKIKQVTRESVGNLTSLANEVFKVSRGFGVSSKEILSVGLTLAQAGRSIDEIKQSLGPLAKTRLAATFGDITDTVNALIAAQEQFKISSSDTEQVLGSLNVLSARYAVEANDLTVAIQKAGGAFASLQESTKPGKRSLNELLALFTAVRSTTRESADTVATGLRTIFARIRRPKTIDFLESFGINLRDTEGLLKGPLEQIQAIAKGIKDINPRDIRFSQIIEEVGGIRQQSKVIPLLQQITKAEQALIVATQGANSLTRDAEIAQLSLANQLTKTREEFLKLINDGFNNEGFRQFSRLVLEITSGFIKMADAIAPILPAITALSLSRLAIGGPGFLSGLGTISKGVKNQFTSKGIKGFANGGNVPGSGRGDKVPAMLEPGEFVIPRDMVSKQPKGFWEALRRGEKPKGYAGGKFDFQPGQVVRSVQEGEQFIRNLFEELGAPFEKYIDSVKRYSKQEENKFRNRLAQAEHGDTQSTIKFKPGLATQGVLAHEVGHVLRRFLPKDESKRFIAETVQQDPLFNNQTPREEAVARLKSERIRLREKKSAEGLTARETARLQYQESETERVARGFSQNPVRAVRRAGLFRNAPQYSSPIGPSQQFPAGVINNPINKNTLYRHPLFPSVVSPPVTPSDVNANIIKEPDINEPLERAATCID